MGVITVSKAALEDITDSLESGVEVREYSGRGMYGEQCLGIVASDVSALVQLVFAVARAVSGDWDHPLGDFMDNMDRVSSDSMGTRVIYYWEGVTLSE